MKRNARHVFLMMILVFALIAEFGALALRAEDIPCTKDGFYYAVCPIQPERSDLRVVDGSGMAPLPNNRMRPDDPRVVDGSRLSVLPTPRLHAAATANKIAAAASTLSILRKKWRSYTMADWMSIASIFLLALVVGVVFYLVNRTLQNERKIAA